MTPLLLTATGEIDAESAGSSTARPRKRGVVQYEQSIQCYHLPCTYLSTKGGRRINILQKKKKKKRWWETMPEPETGHVSTATETWGVTAEGIPFV
jgi:hypothetical protein